MKIRSEQKPNIPSPQIPAQKLSAPSPAQIAPPQNSFGGAIPAAPSAPVANTTLGASLQRDVGGGPVTGGFAQTPSTGAPRARSAASTGASRFAAPNVVLREGSKGQHVTTLQNRLKALGFNPGAADGDFGPKTEAAVKDFQHKAGLAADGVVGPKTWDALEKDHASPAPAPKPIPKPPPPSFKAPNAVLREGSKGQHVTTLQNRLKNLGINPGGVDGNFGPGTANAVRSFQQAAGLSADGVVGPKTWDALEKGKDAMKHPVTPPSGNVPGLGPVSSTRGYVNGVARKIQVATVDGKKVEADTAKAYLRMKAAAAKDGVNLNIVSGFRTMEQQQALWNGWQRRLPGYNPAAKPGYSNHQSGVALDLNTQGSSRSHGTGKVYNWLANNAHKFGFKRIPIEHWHWEYQPGLAKYR